MTDNPIDRVNELQKRIIAGEDPSDEEMAEVIQAMRTTRQSVTETATSRRQTKSKEPVDIAALLQGAKERLNASS